MEADVQVLVLVLVFDSKFTRLVQYRFPYPTPIREIRQTRTRAAKRTAKHNLFALISSCPLHLYIALLPSMDRPIDYRLSNIDSLLSCPSWTLHYVSFHHVARRPPLTEAVNPTNQSTVAPPHSVRLFFFLPLFSFFFFLLFFVFARSVL